MKEKLLISACLLGTPCRYDGAAKPSPAAEALAAAFTLVPICPEEAGGLPTPRPPSEILGARVINRAGVDVTDAFLRGADAAVQTALSQGIRRAVLKARSPSCGRDLIYDGTFSGETRAGDGLTAAALRRIGVRVYTEDEISALMPLSGDLS